MQTPPAPNGRSLTAQVGSVGNVFIALFWSIVALLVVALVAAFGAFLQVSSQSQGHSGDYPGPEVALAIGVVYAGIGLAIAGVIYVLLTALVLLAISRVRATDPDSAQRLSRQHLLVQGAGLVGSLLAVLLGFLLRYPLVWISPWSG